MPLMPSLIEALRSRYVTKNEMIEAQRKLIAIKNHQIAEWQRACLSQTQAAEQVALAARLAIESPEIDLREEFDLLLREIGDQRARLEEQIIE